MVDQHAVATVGQVERDILVRLFGTGAAVAVPGFYRLAITHQCGKALAQAINRFTDAQIQALEHVITLRVVILYIAVILQLAAGDTHAITQKIQRPELTFSDAHAQVTAFQLSNVSSVLDVNLHVL